MTLTLRQAHAAAAPLVSPLAHDALSARLIEQAGFPAFNIGGSSLLAARYALPDLGIAGLGEMAEAMRTVVEAVEIPALVDADDGYGDVKGVIRTVEVLERIGAAGILLEDQERSVKQPEANAARYVAPLSDYLRKLEAALAARRNRDLVVIARTDALGTDGLDEARHRGERALEAGADGVFVAGLRTVAQFERVGAAFRGAWNTAAIFEGPETATLTPKVLHGMGFSQVVYPAALIQRVVRTIEATLARRRLLAEGRRDSLLDHADELSPDGFRAAVALSRWVDLEARLTTPREAAS